VVLTARFGNAFIRASALFAPRSVALRERRLTISAGLALSLLLHGALLLILITSDSRFGNLERLPVLLIEWIDDADDSTDARAANAPAADTSIREQTQAKLEQEAVPQRADEALAASMTASSFDPAVIEPPLAAIEIEEPAAAEIPPLDQPSILSPQVNHQAREPRKLDIAPLQQLALQQRLLAAAQTLHDGASSELAWTEDGRQYEATLTRNPSLGSMDLEHVSVEVTTATDTGARLRTQMTMKRLAFSQFSQVIDRWDPQVQMHDDEIVGRFHSNSSFFIASDAAAVPKFAGKVTTASRGFRTPNGGLRRRREEVFQGGLQTSTGRIELPKQARPFAIDPAATDAHVHRFTDDAHLVFHADGRYSWRERKADVEQLSRYPQDRPVYFIGEPDVTLHVKGTVNGKVLVYSPEKIVIEGTLRYADDPRTNADSDDYLGLVADKYVEIARPYVTGRGDLHIDGAIFARRRFNVTNIDFGRTALLSIYGSLTSGTISATEPRYATKIEFDPRFDRLRPPGFPATNRYEIAQPADTWTEIEEHIALEESAGLIRH
jgi:hypothetical protein